jgi:hypothetical protein
MGTRHVKGSSSGKKVFCKGLQSLGGSTTRRGAKGHKAWDRKAQRRCMAAFVCDTYALDPGTFFFTYLQVRSRAQWQPMRVAGLFGALIRERERLAALGMRG